MYYGLMKVDAMPAGANFNLSGRASSKALKFTCMESSTFKNNYHIKYSFFPPTIRE